MACEAWTTKLDTYLDGELPPEEMRTFDLHVRGCASCAAEALARVQMKRNIQVAGKRFAATAQFRRRVQGAVVSKPKRRFRLAWVFAGGVAIVAFLLFAYLDLQHTRRDQAYGEIADLHIAALASSSQVDVLSSDRHTVKPWFQGKIPFTFDLPELQNSEFSLLGGRMAYLGQAPGAHVIYTVRKHEISVFIVQEKDLRDSWNTSATATKELSFNVASWSHGGLRYFVIGDASAADINSLTRLFQAAGS
ncbi:MAG: zf-HC2 domain-containing protein [Candidatus Sulfotelmatobacter sp.]